MAHGCLCARPEKHLATSACEQAGVDNSRRRETSSSPFEQRGLIYSWLGPPRLIQTSPRWKTTPRRRPGGIKKKKKELMFGSVIKGRQRQKVLEEITTVPTFNLTTFKCLIHAVCDISSVYSRLCCVTMCEFLLPFYSLPPLFPTRNCNVNFCFISCVNPSDLCLSLQTGSAQHSLHLSL